MTTYPQTLVIGQAIASFCAALTYSNASFVYTQTQLGAIKDIISFTTTSELACLEIYAHKDDVQRIKDYAAKLQEVRENPISLER